MFFTVSTTITNYIDHVNLNKDLKFPILSNKTTSEYTLPIFVNNSGFDDSLFTASQTSKSIFHSINTRKKFSI